jgi:hypothetical protein
MGKKVDARSDIYALGIVLYELITGRRPFSADTPMAVVLKQITEPLPRARQFVPDLPEEVEAVLFKALAKEPEQRYVDMGAFASALEQIANHKIPVVKKSHAQDESTVAQFPQQSVSETIQVKKKRLPVWIGVAALLAIAFVMIAGLAIFRYLSGSFPVITDTASNPAAALGEATGTPEPDFTNAPNELLTQTAGTLETKGIQPSLTLTHLSAATKTASPEPEPKIFNFSACVEEPCSEKNNNYSFPEATKIIYLHWDFENMPLGANYVRSWKMENAEWVQYECTWPGPQDSKVDISLREPAGLASGTWSVTITVNGIELLNEQIKIEGNWDYWSPAGTISSCY